MGLHMKKIVGTLFVVGLFLLSMLQFVTLTSLAEESDIYVDSSYRGYSDGSAERPYKTIQYAIDVASSEDTVYVFGGSYDEDFIVNKKITLWGSIDGIPSIIDTYSDIRYTVEVTRDYAEIQGFTFSDAGDHKTSPIGALIAVKADNVIIQSNMFNETSSFGIHLDSNGHGSVISGNYFNDTARGICIESSNTNDIFNNEFQNCSEAGIYISDSVNTRCYANFIKSSLIGITIIGSSNLNLTQNNITSCEYYSIHLENLNGGIIKNNSIHDNNGGGLYLDGTSVSVIDNVFDSNVRGIFLVGSNNNILNNTFMDQTAIGVSAQTVSTNNLLLWNRFRDNAKNADDGSLNDWYRDGEGNYWSDYGFVDRDLDGVGDVAYLKNGVRDLFPLGFFLMPPEKPDDPSPEDMQEGVGLRITFRVKVEDPDSDLVSAFFYRYRQNESDLLIGTDKRVVSGEYAMCQYVQPFDTTFVWYVVVNDTVLENMSDIWYFTTKKTPPDNAPPVAVPGGPYSGSTGRGIVFDASGSNDSDGVIEFYRWNFDDGSSEILARNPSHVYSHPGVYEVTLTVIDDDGASDTETTSVVVVQRVNVLPVVDPGGPYSGRVGSSIVFFGGNSSDVDGVLVNFSWSFGDNSSGFGVLVNHSYGVAGSYLVVLTVVDDDGDSSAVSTLVSVRKRVDGSPGFGVLLVFAGIICILYFRKKLFT
jgi:parallel beta-helix repeat protein